GRGVRSAGCPCSCSPRRSAFSSPAIPVAISRRGTSTTTSRVAASPRGYDMDANAKKTALRMIPYGLYVLTAADKNGGRVAAATGNWGTQVAVAPPLGRGGA